MEHSEREEIREEEEEGEEGMNALEEQLKNLGLEMW